MTTANAWAHTAAKLNEVPPLPDHVTTTKAAELLGWPTRRVRELVIRRHAEWGAITNPRGHWLIPRQTVLDLLAQEKTSRD